MTLYQSRSSTGSSSFVQQRDAMHRLVDKLRTLEQRSLRASNKRLATFKKRGQLAPQERLERLLDPGMPLLRLHSLANYLYEDPDPDTSIPGASILAGIGYVSGVRCLVWVDDSGIRAGAYTKATSHTAMSLQDIAMRQKLPVVHLVESAGANLMDFTVENWIAAGSVFRNLAQLSAAGIPTVTVLHGASTAGGAYMPGMSDYVIGVKNNGLAALGGAALVKAATGEIADERELGGSEMHAEVSGLVEYLAEDDEHGIALAREVVGRLNWQSGLSPIKQRSFDEPVYAPEELAGIVPVDYRVPYDVREVLARVVDASDFQEFKARYGANTVCAQANIMGHACGIVGNNGPIDPEGATKAAQFFQLCDQSNTPIVFLHNTTGYIVGTKSEQAGMIKHGSKMVQAVSNVKVPRIALYIGASFGAGNYGMCGFGFDPDFCFAWPNAVTNVMGGDSAAKTMTQVAEAKAERTGKPVDAEALAKQEAQIMAHFAEQENIFYAAGRLLTHAVIDPRDSRSVLGFALDTCKESGNRAVRPNSFGVARL